MRNSNYVNLDKLIKEYEEDSRTIRSERMCQTAHCGR